MVSPSLLQVCSGGIVTGRLRNPYKGQLAGALKSDLKGFGAGAERLAYPEILFPAVTCIQP